MRKHAAKCLATPTCVNHTPYYMLMHHIGLVTYYTVDVMMSLFNNILGGRLTPTPPPPSLDETLPVHVYVFYLMM